MSMAAAKAMPNTFGRLGVNGFSGRFAGSRIWNCSPFWRFSRFWRDVRVEFLLQQVIVRRLQVLVVPRQRHHFLLPARGLLHPVFQFGNVLFDPKALLPERGDLRIDRGVLCAKPQDFFPFPRAGNRPGDGAAGNGTARRSACRSSGDSFVPVRFRQPFLQLRDFPLQAADLRILLGILRGKRGQLGLLLRKLICDQDRRIVGRQRSFRPPGSGHLRFYRTQLCLERTDLRLDEDLPVPRRAGGVGIHFQLFLEAGKDLKVRLHLLRQLSHEPQFVLLDLLLLFSSFAFVSCSCDSRNSEVPTACCSRFLRFSSMKKEASREAVSIANCGLVGECQREGVVAAVRHASDRSPTRPGCRCSSSSFPRRLPRGVCPPLLLDRDRAPPSPRSVASGS